MNNKDVTSYAMGSKVLHWVIALLVLGMLVGGFYLEPLSEFLKSTYMIHKSIGLMILGLMVIRLVWIIRHGKPKLPASVSRREGIFAHAVQHSLYLLLFLMPLSGWVMSTAAGRPPVFFGWVSMPFPGISSNKSLADFMLECHEIIAYLLIGLIVLHVAGALKHHLIDKDTVLRRMLL